MNSDRRSECYNMIAEYGFAGRNVTDDEIKMEIACKIKWDSVDEFESTYNWCIEKFFDSPADDDLYD